MRSVASGRRTGITADADRTVRYRWGRLFRTTIVEPPAFTGIALLCNRALDERGEAANGGQQGSRSLGERPTVDEVSTHNKLVRKKIISTYRLHIVQPLHTTR